MSAQGWAHGTATATVGTQSCQNALTCRDQDGVKGEDTELGRLWTCGSFKLEVRDAWVLIIRK